jgi:hypothetical protein
MWCAAQGSERHGGPAAGLCSQAMRPWGVVSHGGTPAVQALPLQGTKDLQAAQRCGCRGRRGTRQQVSGEDSVSFLHARTRQMKTTRVRLAVVLRIAMRALTRHLLRSVLSMLGISIGVGAFLCSVAVGQGTARQIEDQIRSLGENFIWIEAGNRNVNAVLNSVQLTIVPQAMPWPPAGRPCQTPR